MLLRILNIALPFGGITWLAMFFFIFAIQLLNRLFVVILGFTICILKTYNLSLTFRNVLHSTGSYTIILLSAAGLFATILPSFLHVLTFARHLKFRNWMSIILSTQKEEWKKETKKEGKEGRKKESRKERERDAVLMHVYIPAIPYVVELWIFTSYHFFICPKKIFLLKCWQQFFF